MHEALENLASGLWFIVKMPFILAGASLFIFALFSPLLLVAAFMPDPGVGLHSRILFGVIGGLGTLGWAMAVGEENRRLGV